MAEQWNANKNLVRQTSDHIYMYVSIDKTMFQSIGFGGFVINRDVNVYVHVRARSSSDTMDKI